MYSEFDWNYAALARNRLTKQYEPLQPFLLMALARTFGADTFLDVGANIGAYSVFFSTMPNLIELHAFEADPDTFRVLAKTLDRNGLAQRVTAHPLAASNRAGEITFGVVGHLSGSNSVLESSIHDAGKLKKNITVQCERLDALIEAKDRRICLKIDVEGHEPEVIEGAAALLSENAALIQIEHYERDRRRAIPELRDAGFADLIRIGPDYYLTNRPDLFSKDTIIAAVEEAAASMIHSNLVDRAAKRKRRLKDFFARLWG